SMLVKLDPNGHAVANFGSQGVALADAAGVYGISSKGNTYIANSTGVVKVTANGGVDSTYDGTLPGASAFVPHGLFADGNDNLLVAGESAGANVDADILKLDPDGTYA